MMRNSSDAYHRKVNKASAYKLDSKFKRLCEDALDILHEIVFADANSQMWFDRPLYFEADGLLDANLSFLPRLITSCSTEKQCNHSRIVKKVDIKISVVEQAIENLLTMKSSSKSTDK